jgi:hypothetical protein
MAIGCTLREVRNDTCNTYQEDLADGVFDRGAFALRRPWWFLVLAAVAILFVIVRHYRHEIYMYFDITYDFYESGAERPCLNGVLGAAPQSVRNIHWYWNPDSGESAIMLEFDPVEGSEWITHLEKLAPGDLSRRTINPGFLGRGRWPRHLWPEWLWGTLDEESLAESGFEFFRYHHPAPAGKSPTFAYDTYWAVSFSSGQAYAWK